MKSISIYKSLFFFLVILALFASSIFMLSNKMIDDTMKSYSKERAYYTADSIIPMLKTIIDFNLNGFLTQNLNEIVKNNAHIYKIVIKKNDGSIIAQSQNEYGVNNKQHIAREFSFDKFSGEILVYSSNTVDGYASVYYKELLTNLLWFIPLAIIIALFLFKSILSMQNKDQETAYIELKQQMEDEIKNHEKKTNMMFHQSRLASMGEMISNIAHQWRQPLNTISLVIQNVKMSYALNNLKKEQFEESMNRIENSLQYMSQTITTFRNFYKTNTDQEEFTTTEVINESKSIIGNNIENSKIELKINNEVNETIVGYKNELTQVIVNILANAKDVFMKRNTPNAAITIHTWKPNDEKVVISIEDNAGGIKEEILGQIFDPYFTTKHKDQGTGLGLYMSNIIIKEKFKGNLSAQNSKDGARFDIELNIAEKLKD